MQVVTEPILHIRKLRPREAVNNRVEQWKLGASLLVLLPTKVSLLPLTTLRFLVSQQYIQKHLETLSRPLLLAVEGLAQEFILCLESAPSLDVKPESYDICWQASSTPPHPLPRKLPHHQALRHCWPSLEPGLCPESESPATGFYGTLSF